MVKVLSVNGKIPLVDGKAISATGGSGSTVELDTTLTQSGKAADAKAVGDALANKQDTISDLETIRSGAAKGATALQIVPNTYRTASEQDTIDSGKVDKVTGKGLSSNDYTDAAKAKVDALAPVATSGSYNDLTNKPTIPTTLPNPNALTFTGAVTGSYDGSEALTVNIPSGGSGSGAEKTWSLLLDETLSEDTAYIFQDLSAPVSELLIEFLAGGDGTHRDVTIFNRNGVGYGNNIATFKNVLRSDETVVARFVIHCVAFPGLAFFRCQYNNYNSAISDNIINSSSDLLLNDDELGAFKGSTNFDCISIGCWGAGNSGVFKAGTKVKVYGKI